MFASRFQCLSKHPIFCRYTDASRWRHEVAIGLTNSIRPRGSVDRKVEFIFGIVELRQCSRPLLGSVDRRIYVYLSYRRPFWNAWQTAGAACKPATVELSRKQPIDRGINDAIQWRGCDEF